MALAKGVNSYVSLEEADAYFEDRLDVAAWTEASDELKEQALVTAAVYLDSIEWPGTVVSVSQPLAFPRIGTYYDPRYGLNMSLDPTPERIFRANMELAYHFLNNDGALDETGGVKNLKVGSISLEFIEGAAKLSSVVRELIKPLRQRAGKYAWWRVN